MDLLTQGLLGAAVAQSGAQQKEIRLATGIGLFSGCLADADILIQSANDPLLNIEFHRHFTHSLIFIPLGALIAAVLLWPFLRQRLPFRRVVWFTLLGYCLSGVLDAFTSYGTHLLWPFTDARSAWNMIAVVDPVFTLILLVATLVAFKRYQATAARIGLVLAALYLSLGWIQGQRAQAVSQMLAAERGHTIERLLVKPTLGNLLLWRSIYQFDGQLQVDAIRVGILSEPKIYPGAAIKRFDPQHDTGTPPTASALAKDIARFTAFSDGWVAIRPEQPHVLVDVRYSNLPNTLTPLWGIEMNPAHPEQPAQYQVYRDTSKATRDQFIAMLLGRDSD